MKPIHSLSISIMSIMLLAGCLLTNTATAADDDTSNQATIEYINRWPNGSPHTITTSPNHVFMGDGNFISVYDKATLTLQARIQISLSADSQIDKDSEIAGTEGVTALQYVAPYLYAACGNEGLKIYDASTPASMSEDDLVATYIARESDGRVNIRDVVVSGNYAYVAYAKFGFKAFAEFGTSSAGYATGIQIINISDPTDPALTGDHELTSIFGDISEARSVCYWESGAKQMVLVADYYQGIHVIDVSNPASPVEEGMCYLGSVLDVDVDADGDFMYVAAGLFGIFAVDTNLSGDRFADGDLDAFYAEDDTTYVCQYNSSATGAAAVDVEGNYAYVGDTEVGVVVLDISTPEDLADRDPDTGQYSAVIGQFASFDVGFNSKPAFYDLDEDGVLDVFSGTWTGYLFQFENAGTVNAPAFADPINSGQLVTGACAPVFGDVDGDGDDDLLIGQKSGEIIYFENDPAASATDNPFVARSGANNPFSDIDVGGYSTPALIDIDNADADNDPTTGVDLFVGAGPDTDVEDGGSDNGKVFYFKNNGDGTFTQQTGASNPLSSASVSSDSTLAFVDIDNDGDQDCFVGSFYGSISFYENTGNAGAASFTKRTGAKNPLDGVGTNKYFSTPAFVDIDNDGDMDCFVGYRDGFTHYYENQTNYGGGPVALEDVVLTRPDPDTLLTGEITGAFHIHPDGNTLYVGDHLEGLQELDITTPASPTLANYIADTGTPSDADAVFFNVNNAGIDYDDSSNNHLKSYTFIVDDDPASGAFREGVRIFYAVLSEEYVTFIMKGFLATDGEAKDVFAHGDYVYVADGSDGLKIIDPELPESSANTKYRVDPTLTGSIAITGGDASGVYVSGNYAYVAAGSEGLRIINVANPASPVESGFIAGTDVSDAKDVYVSGNYAYVADGENGIKAVDISNKGAPVLVGGTTIATNDSRNLSYSGTYLYLADGNEGFHIIDISEPASPSERGSGYETQGMAYGIKAKYDSGLDGDLIWIADGREGLKFYVYYSSIPAQSFGSFDTSGIAKDVDVISSFAFISDGAGGLVSIIAAPPEATESDLDTTPVNIHAVTYGDSGGCAIWSAANGENMLNRIAGFFTNLTNLLTRN